MYLAGNPIILNMNSSKVIQIEFDSFTWIDLTHPTKEVLSEISDRYNLDDFLVRDSVEPGHLPKIEQYKDITFIIFRAYTASKERNATNVQQLSDKVAFFIKDKLLITVHRPHFAFIEELQPNPMPDITLYDLTIDLFTRIVSTYKAPADWHSRQIDEVERIIFLKDLKKISLEELYYQKTETRLCKKLLFQTQNVVNQVQVPRENQTALQNTKDMLVNQILEYEEVHEDANNITNTYLSVAAQKSNDVMKLLTIFSAFFLPLGFIAGFYGMNFHFMPELEWRYSYYVVILVMLVFAILLFWWFKRKKIIP